MFKITGIIIIFVSSIMFFIRKSITDYFTYIFLKQASEICRHLQFECNTGKSYVDFFYSIDKKSYNFFRNLYFPLTEDYIKELELSSVIDKIAIADVNRLLLQLGKRTREKELEFLKYNEAYFENKSLEYKESYKKNSRLNFITGISSGLVVIILSV